MQAVPNNKTASNSMHVYISVCGNTWIYLKSRVSKPPCGCWLVVVYTINFNIFLKASNEPLIRELCCIQCCKKVLICIFINNFCVRSINIYKYIFIGDNLILYYYVHNYFGWTYLICYKDILLEYVLFIQII